MYTVIVLNSAGAEIRRYEGVTKAKYIGDGILLLTFQANIDMEVYVNINTSIEVIETSLIKEAEENAKKKKSEAD